MISGISNAGQYYGYYKYSDNMKTGAGQIQGTGNPGVTGQASKMQNTEGKSGAAPLVQQGVQKGIPFLRKGADPAELAVRMRMKENEDTGVEGAQKAFEKGECKTCKERKYKDGSDDPGVSFKTPTNIAPEQAASAVRGHEMEHVVRENARAQREDRKVVSQSVTIHTAICPECGKAYISGGTTRTTTAGKTQPAADSAGQMERKPFSVVA